MTADHGRPRRVLFSAATRAIFAALVAFLLAPAPICAQEWHEAYRSGLAALQRGDATRAAEALRRAIALRPEPGRNVVTYGTNVEPRYFPYLRLADAYLALGQLEAARETLEASSSWGREPADERQRLLTRLDAAAEQRRPRPPPATPAPPPIAATPAPAPSPTVASETTPAPPSLPAAASSPVGTPPAPTRPPPTAPQAATRQPAPPTTIPPVPSPPAEDAATSTIEIVSRPPGATVYIDDEPVGSTDPETGRLLKALPAGRHRVRVAYTGLEDTVRDVDVPVAGRALFHASLGPPREASLASSLGFAALAVAGIALVAVLAWVAFRRQEPPGAIFVPTPRPPPTADRGPSTPGRLSPGARRDEMGQDWFGHFRLLEMLGRGGMASVFKAERRGELSALKRPLASFLDDPQFRERFLREAEIGRTLNHPNIVRILERGEVEGVPYFTMELVAGQTLGVFVRQEGLVEPRAAASIVVQAAEALDFAHTKGVVHRDLKPSNIMLLADGTAKVMDFGIARARRFEGLTATGAFLGTPEYVAPEMIDGSPTDARSDLYALGVILFELLAGERPFSGETPFAILKKHSLEEPPPPSRIRPEVPAELDAIVLRLLRKDPAERPDSAEALVIALRDWLNRAA